MLNSLKLIAHLGAITGVLLCIVAGLARFSGAYFVGGYSAMTLFNLGIGLMVFALLCKVELLLRTALHH
tara:strand:- start:31 stop:237 length:207 start_codon:yes stop_codon:yes gene_type:complete